MLNIKGRIIRAIEGNSTSTQETKFDWKDAVLDATIMACITGITSYIGTSNLQGSILAGALSWFTFIGIKRGLERLFFKILEQSAYDPIKADMKVEFINKFEGRDEKDKEVK